MAITDFSARTTIDAFNIFAEACTNFGIAAGNEFRKSEPAIPISRRLN